MPDGFESPPPPKPEAKNSRGDVARNSDLDLSEVEGGRTYAPANTRR